MDLPDLSAWQVVKWVLIVLAAAFIGQFGKTLAQYLMSRIRRKKRNEQEPILSAEGGQNSEKQTGEALLRNRKKEEKAWLKAQKKADKTR